MALQSLIAEITGAIPVSSAAAKVAAGMRLLVVFEDAEGLLRAWQRDLLWIDRGKLRLLNVSVASLPSDQRSDLPDVSNYACGNFERTRLPLAGCAMRQQKIERLAQSACRRCSTHFITI